MKQRAEWTETQKEAWKNGALDRMSGYTRAYKVCKERKDDENCQAYCLGYTSSGAGE